MAKFIYTRLTDYALTASGGTAAGFLLDNLKTYDYRKEWKSGSTANGQTLVADMGATAGLQARDSLILDQHSSFEFMTIDLEAADNAAFTSGKVVPISNLMASGTPPTPNQRQFWEFTSVTKRYWRLEFVNTGAVAPQVGQWFVDAKADMGDAIGPGWSLGNASLFKTETEEMLDGWLKSSQQNKGRKRFELRFTLINNTVLAMFTVMQQTTRGALNPFYLNDATSLWIVKNESDYSAAHGRAYQLNDTVKLNLVEPHALRN